MRRTRAKLFGGCPGGKTLEFETFLLGPIAVMGVGGAGAGRICLSGGWGGVPGLLCGTVLTPGLPFLICKGKKIFLPLPFAEWQLEKSLEPSRKILLALKIFMNVSSRGCRIQPTYEKQ